MRLALAPTHNKTIRNIEKVGALPACSLQVRELCDQPLERVNTHTEFNSRSQRQAEALQTSTHGLKHAGYGRQRKAKDMSMLSRKELTKLSSFGL